MKFRAIKATHSRGIILSVTFTFPIDTPIDITRTTKYPVPLRQHQAIVFSNQTTHSLKLPNIKLDLLTDKSSIL